MSIEPLLDPELQQVLSQVPDFPDIAGRSSCDPAVACRGDQVGAWERNERPGPHRES